MVPGDRLYGFLMENSAQLIRFREISIGNAPSPKRFRWGFFCQGLKSHRDERVRDVQGTPQ